MYSLIKFGFELKFIYIYEIVFVVLTALTIQLNKYLQAVQYLFIIQLRHIISYKCSAMVRLARHNAMIRCLSVCQSVSHTALYQNS